MRKFILSKNLILQNKKVVILHVNLLPELNKINHATKEIIRFINKYKKNYTFFIPTFTNRYFYRSGKLNFFHKKSKCTNGYFANYLINSQMGLRSNHPTHSYYFIGKEAKRFCRLSNVNDGPFEIINKIGIENISFLNINTKGLPTFHLAENILGYSKSILVKFIGSFYKKKEKKILWYNLKYLNGCDRKYNLLTNRYIKSKLFNIKKCSNSVSYFGNLLNIFQKDLKFMEGNREFFNCNKCVYCKFIHEKKKLKVLFFIFKNYNFFFSILKNIVFESNEIKNYYFRN